MVGEWAECRHPRGLRNAGGPGFRCPDCGSRLDLEGVARWVREAERERDEAYSLVEVDESDEFPRMAREERQREVYRRRRVLYELRDVPRAELARPELILIVYEPRDSRSGTYECRIFYKEPHPSREPDRLSVGPSAGSFARLRAHPDPNVRLASEKAGEFHAVRADLARRGAEFVPTRRAFFADEL